MEKPLTRKRLSAIIIFTMKSARETSSMTAQQPPKGMVLKLERWANKEARLTMGFSRALLGIN